MIVNGTTYSDSTPKEVVKLLELHRQVRLERLRLSYGDAKTGKDWLEEADVEGYIGRSTGTVKIPLLIANRRSTGGPEILDHCIVRIKTASGGRVLWQHPKYHNGEFRGPGGEIILPSTKRGFACEIHVDGKFQARFKNREAARQWLHKMN